jgi:hypothetical protein
LSIFFKTLFSLDFFSNAEFLGVFLKSKIAACLEMAFLSFINHPIFKKSSTINDKFKNKSFNGFIKDICSTKKTNGLQAEKFNMAPKI